MFRSSPRTRTRLDLETSRPLVSLQGLPGNCNGIEHMLQVARHLQGTASPTGTRSNDKFRTFYYPGLVFPNVLNECSSFNKKSLIKIPIFNNYLNKKFSICIQSLETIKVIPPNFVLYELNFTSFIHGFKMQSIPIST